MRAMVISPVVCGKTLQAARRAGATGPDHTKTRFPALEQGSRSGNRPTLSATWRRLLPPRNARRCRWEHGGGPTTVLKTARRWALAVAAIAWYPAATTAQDASGTERPGVQASPDAAPRQPSDARAGMPSAAETLLAFAEVERWVRAMSAPQTPARIDPEGAAGACVTLRLSGAPIGRGTDLSGDGMSVWRAARAAIIQATESAPVPRDALREEALLDVAKRITIDVQVAGRMVPLLGDTFADAAASVSHGVEGVAARVGQRVRAFFPGSLLNANAMPSQGMAAACADLDLPRVELGALRREHGVIVYKFLAHHLTQLAPSEGPVFLFRGGRVVQPTDVSTRAVREAATAIATHLMSRELRRGDTHVILGDYQPWTDSYEPLLATPVQKAIIALALFRHAQSHGHDPAHAARAARFAWTALDLLVEHEPESLNEPAVAAAYVCALEHALTRPPGMRAVASAESDATQAAYARLCSVFDPDHGWDEQLPVGARALAAYALTLARDSTPHEAASKDAVDARARGAVRSLLRDTPPGMLIGAMPWLGWAELTLSGEGGQIASAPALREMRDLLWRHQVSFADAGDDSPDFVGGFVFTASRSLLPNWQAARPLAFVATMLADPRMSDEDELGGELARLSLSLRFLLQLMVDDALMHMFRDRERALGGVRASPWDQRLQIDANVMTLLALDETVGAIRVIGARRSEE